MHRSATSFQLALASVLIAIAGLTSPASANDQTPGSFYLKKGDRVVFYGDSITEQKLYTGFVETFVLTRFPGLDVTFYNSGWGGDRVSGGGGGLIATRLERDVYAYNPTVMTVMLGMNDAAYRAFDESIFSEYSTGYRSLVQTVLSRFPELRMTLIMPSPYDDVTRPPTFAGGYNSVLLKYGQFVRTLADERKTTVADMNSPVVAMLGKASKSDLGLSQKIIEDRVHPGPGGHIIMAAALLKAWNAPSLVTGVSIDASQGVILKEEETTISDLVVGETISWTQADNRLPFPINWSDQALALAVHSSDFMNEFNSQILAVSGLSANSYALAIDGSEVGTFSAADLSKGINLANLQTPMQAQAARVAELTQLHNEKHFWRWRQIQIKLPLESANAKVVIDALPATLSALDKDEERVVHDQRLAAIPKPRKFEIRPALIPTTPNYALNKPNTDSHKNSIKEWTVGLTDGVKAGRENHVWASNADNSFPKKTTIDLGEQKAISIIRVAVPEYGSTKTIEISLSEDGSNFQPVGSHVFPQRQATMWNCNFPSTKARFIRLTFPDHHNESVEYDPNYIFVSEVEAYGPPSEK